MSRSNERGAPEVTETELAYLERRAATEADLAERARCPAAVQAHYQLSRAYFESAEALKQVARLAAR